MVCLLIFYSLVAYNIEIVWFFLSTDDRIDDVCNCYL